MKIGTPEHAKYYKGTVIRNTNALVTNFTKMLVVASVHQYLTKVEKIVSN